MSGLEPFASIDALTADLAYENVPEEQVVEGGPRTGARDLATAAGAEIGIWELTAGTARDIEVDEVFVVIDGHGTVSLEADGGEQQIALSPGVVCRLTAGMTTRWVVPDRLRKVYILGSPGDASS
ncbi:cupin domain-containing protein [Microbacterium sp. 1P10UB]|uniref:cupin domain-containing protein n=1 Tax=unclassified Microbacterium TaxID=2609290 RepID=UPI0039A32304